MLFDFLANAGVPGIFVLVFGIAGLMFAVQALRGSERARLLVLPLSGVALLLGIAGTAVGLFKHLHVVADAAPDKQVVMLAALVGIPATSTGLAAIVAAVNLLLYGVATYRAKR